MAGMTDPRRSAVLLLVGALALAGCGGERVGPDEVARDFATAWTEARCQDAMAYVAEPDDSWTDACERAFHFGTKCDEVQPGDPRPTDCGKGTTIAVRTTEVTQAEEAGDTADLAVLVAYSQGKNTRESRTLRVRLEDQDDGWKVVKVG